VLLGPELLVREEHDRLQRSAVRCCSRGFLFAGFFHLCCNAGPPRASPVAFSGIALSLASVTAGINTFGAICLLEQTGLQRVSDLRPILVLPWFITLFFGVVLPRSRCAVARALGCEHCRCWGFVTHTLHHPFYRFFEARLFRLRSRRWLSALILALGGRCKRAGRVRSSSGSRAMFIGRWRCHAWTASESARGRCSHRRATSIRTRVRLLVGSIVVGDRNTVLLAAPTCVAG